MRLLALPLALPLALFAVAGAAQTPSAAPNSAPPAMMHPLIPSHGTNLLGVLYLAAGAGPHPTAILFHGFPGYEQNLDLAQALRGAGWNILAYHYRGSWGVPGTFTFLHAAEDADAEVQFALDPANAQRYRIDPNHLVVIGHSMGGFMAASAAAHNPQVKAAVLLSAWNIGASRPAPWSEADEAKALATDNNLVPLADTSGPALAHEEFSHRAELDWTHLAPVIAPRPVLLVTANDHSDQFATPFAAALTSAGDTHVVEQHFPTDHPYSGYRTQLAERVQTFLEKNK